MSREVRVKQVVDMRLRISGGEVYCYHKTWTGVGMKPWTDENKEIHPQNTKSPVISVLR